MIIVIGQVREDTLLPVWLLLRLPPSLREQCGVHEVLMHVLQRGVHSLSILQSIVCSDNGRL